MSGREGGTVLVGVVRPGRTRGRQLGFPTANLEVDRQLEGRLDRGVFAGWVRWGERRQQGAVVNIGRRPTFGEGQLSVEVHLLDFAENLYGETLEVQLVEKLRDERRFPNVEELVAQIAADVEKTRAVLHRRTADNIHTEVE